MWSNKGNYQNNDIGAIFSFVDNGRDVVKYRHFFHRVHVTFLQSTGRDANRGGNTNHLLLRQTPSWPTYQSSRMRGVRHIYEMLEIPILEYFVCTTLETLETLIFNKMKQENWIWLLEMWCPPNLQFVWIFGWIKHINETRSVFICWFLRNSANGFPTANCTYVTLTILAIPSIFGWSICSWQYRKRQRRDKPKWLKMFYNEQDVFWSDATSGNWMEFIQK